MSEFDYSALFNQYYQQPELSQPQMSSPQYLDTQLPAGQMQYPPPSGANPVDIKGKEGMGTWQTAAMTIGKSLLGLLGKGGGGGPIGFAPQANIGSAYPFNMPKDIYPERGNQDVFKALLARYLAGGG